MHRFKDAVVSAAHGARVELLQRRAKEIAGLPIGSIPTNLAHDLAQKLAHWLGALGRLCRILAHVLDHRPEIQHRSPIHIPEVRKQDVRFVRAHQWVVTWQAQEPRPWLVALFHTGRRAALSRAKRVWKAVAAHRALFLATSTRVDTKLGRPHEVQSMPRTRLHQSR